MQSASREEKRIGQKDQKDQQRKLRGTETQDIERKKERKERKRKKGTASQYISAFLEVVSVSCSASASAVMAALRTTVCGLRSWLYHSLLRGQEPNIQRQTLEWKKKCRNASSVGGTEKREGVSCHANAMSATSPTCSCFAATSRRSDI